MSWLSDAWDAVIDVAEEIPIISGVVEGGRALADFVPGFIDDVGDVLSSPIDTIVDGAEFVGEALAGFGALVLSPLAISGDIIGGVTEFVGEVVDTVTFGGAGWVMDQVDDYVFDTVDWATGGAIDIDFDDGAFSVDLGMNELASVGFSIGEQGFTADGFVAGLGAGVGMTKDDGLTVDLKADLPLLDEVGVGVGLDLDEGGDDAFFLDFDGRVLGGDAPADSGDPGGIGDTVPDDGASGDPGGIGDSGGGVIGEGVAVAAVTAQFADAGLQASGPGGVVRSADAGDVFAATVDVGAVVSEPVAALEIPDSSPAVVDDQFTQVVVAADAVADAAADELWTDLA